MRANPIKTASYVMTDKHTCMHGKIPLLRPIKTETASVENLICQVLITSTFSFILHVILYLSQGLQDILTEWVKSDP